MIRRRDLHFTCLSPHALSLSRNTRGHNKFNECMDFSHANEQKIELSINTNCITCIEPQNPSCSFSLNYKISHFFNAPSMLTFHYLSERDYVFQYCHQVHFHRGSVLLLRGKPVNFCW